MRARRRKLLWAGLTVFVGALAMLRWVIIPYRVTGPSMHPTLLGSPGSGSVGDLVLVNRLAFWREGPSRWDVVMLEREGQEYVKRVVGLPGEKIEMREGELWIDGVKAELPAQLQAHALVSKGTFGRGPVALGPGEYFLLGDGGYLSLDSRAWGPIARAELRGSVAAIVWPPSRAGRVE